MLLHNSLKETGYPFHYPHAGLRGPQLSSEKSKIMALSNAAPLFVCLKDEEGAKYGSHNFIANPGHENRVGFCCCKGNSLFPNVWLPRCGLLETLSSSWPFLGQCHHCLCARPARKTRLELSREGNQDIYKHPLLGDYENNWMKGKLNFRQINYSGKS